jgi:hypothetical protein
VVSPASGDILQRSMAMFNAFNALGAAKIYWGRI